MADGLLRLSDGRHVVDALARHISRAFQLCSDFRYFDGVAMNVRLSSVRASGRFHSHQRGRRHLSASHAVDGVVDKDDRDVVATVQGVDGFSRADAGQVAVALIGKHQAVGPEALAGAGQGRSASVGGLLPVDVKVAVGKDGASHRTDADGFVFHAHFGNHFGNQLVHNAV